MKNFFSVDGKPFFVLGGQVHNSSSYDLASMATAWQAAALLKANTVEVPAYWEQVEPQEGRFYFDGLDKLVLAAREHNLRLVLLWFATWKNGSMQYAPQWVKANPERFQRVITPAGSPLWVLSSHCTANLEADRSAFSQLVQHIKEFDRAENTIIAIQIENEPGILGSVRDHGPKAEEEFNSEVPSDLVQALQHAPDGPEKQAWQQAGGAQAGSWEKLFGERAGEYFTTWSIARYIDQVAAAGKAIDDIPMYVNVWLSETGWRRPGANYPSGGAGSWVVNLWKWAAPNVDLIAPDIYVEPADVYREVCAAYSRTDNPLFVPESGGSLSNSINLFEAVANYHATGYAIFGIESLLAPDGGPKPETKSAVESFHCLAAALPLITRFYKTGQVYAVAQHEFMGEQLFDFGSSLGMAVFQSGTAYHFSDFRHAPLDRTQRGRGLIFAASQNEFFLVGCGYRLMLKRKASEAAEFSKAHDYQDGPMTPYLSVEEGHFAEDGNWVIDRRRNGDEITNGLWVTEDIGVVHAVLTGQ